ncbi:DivIVA domain-containing protein [Salinibacterium sp. NK8237]|uniref:DivIVA domain-containing protein n=1 Tax=Salinibacterium sp. NK8237 TaxID=2792038 RepID=UPI0018CE6363|nr:DivIVA domain-containing protein [Salinibacterium sp. NK8237]MBH0128892.1 DivIVA domain-containing protein [Salinibacterium sp. NK8237]
MALTPEDVVNKRFESTKFREGYDQDDVDDFLDEVVVELRRLNQENDELRQRLSAAEARATELQQNASSAPAAAAPAAIAAPAPAAIESAPAPAAIEPASSVLDDASSTNNLLQLARRLHEEHVREGVQKRDALIAEGQASAAEILAEGQASAAEVVAESKATAAELVAQAQAQQREQIGTLERERQALEGRIESLRSFEREYREKLKSYIEGQLHELDSSSLVTAGSPSGQQGQTGTSQSSGQLTAEDFASPQSAQQPPASFSGFSGS